MTNLTDLALSDTLTVTGATTFTGAITANGGISAGEVGGVTSFGPLVKLAQTVGFASFTDGGATTGTFDLTVGTIPIGATFLYSAVTAVTGFAGNVTAVLTIGDGTDVDRYNTSTINVFATAANGVSAGAPSGTVYHSAAATVKLTVTTATDFTSVSAGSVSIELFYVT